MSANISSIIGFISMIHNCKLVAPLFGYHFQPQRDGLV